MNNALFENQIEARPVADCGALTLPGLGTPKTLPDIPCKYAMLASWTTDTNATPTAKSGATASIPNTGAAGVEMYFGFNGKLFAQLFTGDRTELLPVSNLNQITVSGTGTIYYAWFN